MNISRFRFFFSKEALIILFFSIIVKIPDINVHLRGDIETFILIADSYLKGEFTSYFDNKSQILYSIYAAILYLSGHDLRIFQLYGILILFITALLISKCFKEKQNSLYAAIIYIFFSALFNDGGDYIMSEHIAVIPVLISFIFLNKEKITNHDLFLVGAILALSSLIRQNFMILHFFISLYLLLKINKTNIITFLYYCAGSAFTWIIVLAIIYLSVGIEYFITNFFAEITQSPEKGYFFNFYRLSLFGLHIHNFNLYNYENIKIVNSLIFYIFSFVLFVVNFKKIIKKNIIFFIYLFSITLGIFFTGSYNTHYLIQVMPFLAILIIQFLPKKKFVKTLLKINIIFLILVLFFDYNYYFNKNNRSTYENYTQLINWLNNNLDPSENVYLYRGHSIYTKIHQEPLTNFAHPPNIFKEDYLKFINNDKSYTSLKEWQNILKNKPKFIVLGIDDSFDYFLKKVNDLDFKKNNYDKIQDVVKIGTYQIIRIF